MSLYDFINPDLGQRVTLPQRSVQQAMAESVQQAIVESTSNVFGSLAPGGNGGPPPPPNNNNKQFQNFSVVYPVTFVQKDDSEAKKNLCYECKGKGKKLINLLLIEVETASKCESCSGTGHKNVIFSDDHKLIPAPGYSWVDFDAKDDFRVCPERWSILRRLESRCKSKG